jgi:protein phosphatase
MVIALSEEHPGWAEMGTTIVVALLSGNSLVIGHVGDSRAYAVDPDGMRQLTEDHSFVAESIREGLLTVSEARTHKSRHGLTLALGVEDQVEPELTSLHWKEDTCLLLCSDGLNEMLDDGEILAIIKSSANPQQACNNLVERANEKGGTDNISVILACNKTR